MSQFAVVQQGVYIQAVWAPFSDLDQATEWAKLRADADTDEYHDWTVCEISPTEALTRESTVLALFKHKRAR